MSIFDPLNTFADDVERRLPRWLQYDLWGDPISWVHHAVWALLCAAVGALIGLLVGLPRLGAKIGALLALTFYVAREGERLWAERGRPGALWRGRPHWTGWLVDGVLDCVGPALVVWLVW